MADVRDIDDQVDFEDDNYEEEEEMDDDVEDHADDDNDSDDNNNNDSEKEDVRVSEGDNNNNKEKSSGLGGDDKDNKKRAELLALPPHGSEVFIGGLPRDVAEEDLSELCEPFGDVVEVRLVRNRDTNESKGFAFVAFKSKDVAQKAIEELHDKDFKGRTLRCSLSESKYRLFIGNVPKTLTEDEFRKIIEETGPGSEVIELIKDPQNPSRNRGFAFVEYYNNACADYSRLKLSSPNFKLDGNTPTVTWADPKITPDHSASAQVKALYVKNIPENTPTEQLKELFQRHGEVTRVVTPPAKIGCKRDFGFVHFAERSSALKAVKDGERYEIDGQVLEVVLAKPQNDRKSDNSNNPHHSGPHPNYIPHTAYGGFTAASPYAAPRYGVTPSFQQQPMIYGRGPLPGGMQMVPMVLPDGQIGYVLQQPGTPLPAARPPRRNERGSSNGSGGRVRGGSSGDDANRGRYRPY
ncbi:heterogeneous nuclear ribonucleoprotein Q-like isoform X1 [Bidens hawaiensis]|uniref:heterogeneous nuclear ribonucleoprotein Q-like isoform X1 n=1 Tax=Bidens hawaiensis TaxID=980011 RepID=UPI00404B4AE9